VSAGEAKHRELGLTDPEHERIVELLGRDPNDVELAMFSLLWSEHCAYKHSRRLLRRLPTEGPRVLMGPGENAGAVALSNGLAAAFKVESHNHPSAVEPFQGAATGVGGILRDVFALGARPIALLNSLRFGELDSERSRYLLDGVVGGIGHYGNSIGVPTVGGEIYFEGPYEHNCLVNAMCVGLARPDRMIRSAATGPGNLVVLLGASTGRDGIGGASVLASAELAAGDERRPSVQIGDPFEESKLIECCLELGDRDLLVALQDLGAAGLTSSLAEMAAKGKVGLDLDLDRVPLREPEMEPWEVMVSESQERMVAIVAPASVEEVLEVCERWQTGAATIGEVTEGERIRVCADDQVVADLPLDALVDGAPAYELDGREPEEWIYPNADVLAHRCTEALALAGVRPEGGARDAAKPRPQASQDADRTDGRTDARSDPSSILLALLASPSIASKRWAFEQYDSIVQSRTVRRPEAADAAVLQVGDGPLAIAVTIDGNGRRVACDPYLGSIEAVLEGVQNLACVGAEPLGLTDCLNFGNPEKPSIAWQLERAVVGLAEACNELGIPVVGGNVSLYNEGEAGPIYPTPIVGLLGELPDAGRAGGAALRNGDVIAVAGPFAPALAGSELAKLRGELGPGLPALDISRIAEAASLVREAVRSGGLACAHDVSDGGLAAAIAECAIAGGVGARVDLEPLVELRAGSGEAWLFGEGLGGFVLAAPPETIRELARRAGENVVLEVGVAGGDRLEISAAEGEISLPLAAAERAWRSLGARLASTR
jgi:phosphoribosylformylglycinamidine synthase